MRRRYLIPVVVCGALVITALGIDASDTFTGSRATLLATLFVSSPSAAVCPSGTVPLKTELQTYCVDSYEASVGDSCPHPVPTSREQTAANVSAPTCVSRSTPGVLPWRFVARAQAEQLCAKSGKQLMTPQIWYQAALGTNDSGVCNTKGNLEVSGGQPGCRSGIGAFDMIGNVWELVAGDVVNGTYANITLPQSGYVAGVSEAGIPLTTQATSSPLYEADYLWSQATGTYAVMRGGFYGGTTDAGLYSMQAAIPVDFSSGAVGFRCMSIL